MTYPEEVHPWTIEWFETLPQAYQTLDAAQQNPPMQLWDGLNPEPFDLTTTGGWTTDVDEPTERAIFRQFSTSAGQKIYYQIWVKPNATPGGNVTITVYDLLMSNIITLQGPNQLTNVTAPETLEGFFYPPLHGQFTVHIAVTAHDAGAGPIAGAYPLLDAVSLSKRHVTYLELPRKTGDDEPTCHPLLRYMDGIGRIGGQYRTKSDLLWDGHYTNPDTCPDQDLPWLAQMLGIHRRIYRNLEPDPLRALIKNTATQGLAALGSRASIAEIVRPHLIGDQKISVAPHPTQKHVIRVKIRIDEIPDKNIDRVTDAVRGTGVIPAGHQIIIEDGVDTTPTWAQWEAAAGSTWTDLESRAPRWTDADILGTPD